jgi:hypothetical protein
LASSIDFSLLPELPGTGEGCIMASTAVEVPPQDGNGSVAKAPAKSESLIPTLMKSAVDQTVKAVTTVVQTEIRALPKQIVAAVLAKHAETPAKPPKRAASSSDDGQGLPKSQQLWNDAYDGLEEGGATSGIVQSYAETLTYAIAGEDEKTPGPEMATLAAELKDPVKRQAHMRDLVQKGREKFADDSKLAQTVGDVAGFVLQARGVIDVAIKNVPQAALPWAGVCVGLQVRTIRLKELTQLMNIGMLILVLPNRFLPIRPKSLERTWPELRMSSREWIGTVRWLITCWTNEALLKARSLLSWSRRGWSPLFLISTRAFSCIR